MVRRKTKNKTGIERIPSVNQHYAWVSYTCIKCKFRNYEEIGMALIDPREAYENCIWVCSKCEFIHSRDSELPFDNWAEDLLSADSPSADRFWQAFFRSATENPTVYWKQCNTCGRILPNNDFSRHKDWGPLEKQMECRACKGAINAVLNPKRTTEQLRESSLKRRIAELLVSVVEEDQEKLDVQALFTRFDNKCFKTKKPLSINDPTSWQIDHTLPARYFYPLSVQNATLLSTEANQNKSGKWPSEFYSNKELVELSKITGASLELLSSETPVINQNIDVNACVDKFLNVRDSSSLHTRVNLLKLLLEKNNLSHKLSDENKKRLGIG